MYWIRLHLRGQVSPPILIVWADLVCPLMEVSATGFLQIKVIKIRKQGVCSPADVTLSFDGIIHAVAELLAFIGVSTQI